MLCERTVTSGWPTGESARSYADELGRLTDAVNRRVPQLRWAPAERAGRGRRPEHVGLGRLRGADVENATDICVENNKEEMYESLAEQATESDWTEEEKRDWYRERPDDDEYYRVSGRCCGTS